MLNIMRDGLPSDYVLHNSFGSYVIAQIVDFDNLGNSCLLSNGQRLTGDDLLKVKFKSSTLQGLLFQLNTIELLLDTGEIMMVTAYSPEVAMLIKRNKCKVIDIKY